MSTTLDSVRSKAVKGPGLKVPGVVILQFLLIFIFEALEYTFTKVGFFTGLAIFVSFLGGLYLGRPGTSYTNAVNPPISFLISIERYIKPSKSAKSISFNSLNFVQ